jgi:hypothetical protein
MMLALRRLPVLALRVVPAAVGVTAGLLLVAPAQVGAQAYSTTDRGTVTDDTPAPGQTITLEVDGFAPSTAVNVTLRPDGVVLGAFIADADGRVLGTLTIPSGLSEGPRAVVASGTGPGGVPVEAAVPITIVRTWATPTTTPTSPGRGLLPRTGTDVAATVTVGGVLIVVGAASARAARRRPGHDGR